jgi:hypothetical protein
MWESTYSKTFADVTKESVWALWADVNHWHEWDHDIEWARMSDAFAEGSRFELKPKGGPRVPIRFSRVEALRGYTDLTKFPLAAMYGIHDMEETPDGLKLTVTIRIEGPLSWLWKKIVAQNVAADMPKQLDSLTAYARARA